MHREPGRSLLSSLSTPTIGAGIGARRGPACEGERIGVSSGGAPAKSARFLRSCSSWWSREGVTNNPRAPCPWTQRSDRAGSRAFAVHAYAVDAGKTARRPVFPPRATNSRAPAPEPKRHDDGPFAPRRRGARRTRSLTRKAQRTASRNVPCLHGRHRAHGKEKSARPISIKGNRCARGSGPARCPSSACERTRRPSAEGLRRRPSSGAAPCRRRARGAPAAA